MAVIIADRVLETSTTTGTGAYTLAGAVTGYQAFSGVCANNDTCDYYAEDVDANGKPIGDWETGLGTWGTGGILTRTAIYHSSNANASIVWKGGIRRVALGFTAHGLGTLAPLANPTFTGTIAGITAAMVGAPAGSGTSTGSNTGDQNLSGLVPYTGATSNVDLNGKALGDFKTATFTSQVNNAATSGAITIDWTTGQNQSQAQPSGGITYTFTAPPGPCHLQLFITSSGTSTAQTITWPGTVIWMNSTWTATNNKKAIINFWYDGSNYYAMGGNQV